MVPGAGDLHLEKIPRLQVPGTLDNHVAVDLRGIARAGLPMLAMFVLGAAGKVAGVLAGMAVVGRKFGAHEIFLPEVLLAARAMNAGVEVLKPLLIAEDVPRLGKVVIGTVKGDFTCSKEDAADPDGNVLVLARPLDEEDTADV